MRQKTEPACGNKRSRNDTESGNGTPIGRGFGEVERESVVEIAADCRASQRLQVEWDNTLIDGNRETS